MERLQVILTNPEIEEAAVVAVPDSRYGEVVGAWIVRKPGSTVSREVVRATVSRLMNPQVSKIAHCCLNIRYNISIERTDVGILCRRGWNCVRVTQDGERESHEACSAGLESGSGESEGRTCVKP